MLLGKRFFPDTGIPIWKIARSSVLFAVWLPDPFTVATWIEHSLTMGAGVAAVDAGFGAVVAWVMGLPESGAIRPIRCDSTGRAPDARKRAGPRQAPAGVGIVPTLRSALRAAETTASRRAIRSTSARAGTSGAGGRSQRAATSTSREPWRPVERAASMAAPTAGPSTSPIGTTGT